jgi:hypothetical protein
MKKTKDKQKHEIFSMPIICYLLDEAHKATNLAKVLAAFGRKVEDYEKWILRGDSNA